LRNSGHLAEAAAANWPRRRTAPPAGSRCRRGTARGSLPRRSAVPRREESRIATIAPQDPRSRRAGRVRPFLAAALLGLGLAAAGTAAGAPSALDVQRSTVRGLEEELAGLDARAQQAAAAEQVAAAELAAARARLRRNAQELRVARAAHRRAQERLADRLVAIYRQGQPSLVDILLAPGGLSEAVDRMRSLERIGDLDADIVRGLTATRARLSSLRVRLSADRRVAGASLREATARRAELDALVGQRRVVLASAQRTLSAMIAAEARRQAAEAAQREAARRAAARLDALRAARRDVSARLATPSADPLPSPPPGAAPSDATLQAIAQCESGGDPRAVSSNGMYRGKYQFHPDTWHSIGGTGDPATAPEGEQDRLAAKLYAREGRAPWPVCGLSAP
jgi:peptidoglycan hydrolase CwlO-like protein